MEMDQDSTANAAAKNPTSAEAATKKQPKPRRRRLLKDKIKTKKRTSAVSDGPEDHAAHLVAGTEAVRSIRWSARVARLHPYGPAGTLAATLSSKTAEPGYHHPRQPDTTSTNTFGTACPWMIACHLKSLA